jgi:hypothetical protein
MRPRTGQIRTDPPHIPGEHPIRLQRCAQVIRMTPIQSLGVSCMAFRRPGARVDCMGSMDLP